MLLQGARPAYADSPTTLGTTPWQVYVDNSTYPSPYTGSVHGYPTEFDAAPAVPSVSDAGWANCGPGAPTRTSPHTTATFSMCPNASTIGLAGWSILQGCWTSLNFTYFQSLVSIPDNTTISTFSVDMSGADDGARVSLVNSAHPLGITPAGGYIYSGTPQSTSDLSSYVVAGEVNRVVITQVDDCATGNNLHSASISLNGEVVQVIDNDLAIATNPDVSVEANSQDGAVVTYALPAVTNETPVTPDCLPASGSLFPVGTTTVTCTAIDADDENSPATSTFQVTVTLPTQTVSILGGSGTTGTVDTSTDWSWDVAQADGPFDGQQHTWHLTGNANPVWYPAYLAGSHPWGFVPGTNNWLNCGPDVSSSWCEQSPGDIGSLVTFRSRFVIPDGSINPDITFWINSDNAGTYYLNGVQVTDRLVGGDGTGLHQVGESGCAYVNSTTPYCPAGVYPAAVQSALTTGINVLTVVVEDWGGAAGFNYRADVTVEGTEPPVIIPAPAPTTTTVSFGAGPFVYNGSAFTATASVSPAAAGSATIVYSGDCTNVGSTCTATATFVGGDDYATSTATASITIAPAPVTATAGGGSATYDGTAQAPSACVVSGGFTGALSCANDPASVGPDVGTTAISPMVSGAGLANFDVTTVPGSFTIDPASTTTTVSFGTGPFVYNGTAFTATASVSPPAAGSATIVYSGDCTNVGSTCVATATFAGTANYDGSSATASITIDPAPVTATAGSGSSWYDGTAHAPSGCVVSGAYTGDLSCENDPTTVGPDVGTTGVSPVVSGTGLENFAVTTVSGSYTIEPAAVTVTAGSGSSAYDGTAQTPSGCVVGGAYTGDLTCANDPASVGPDVGTTVISPVVSGTGLANFDLTLVDGSYTIEPAAVTATAGSGSSTYDGSAHSPSACVVTGAYIGDLICANAPATVGPDAGTTALAPVVSGTGLSNYVVTLVDGSYTIERAPTTITISGGGAFTYDGSGHPLSAVVTGAGGLNLTIPVIGCGPNPTLPADSCTGTASYAGDPNHFGSTATASVTITIDYVYPAGGVFVVGDGTPHGLLSTVNFWGSQWAKQNSLTGGKAPSSFKGFENSVGAPACGSTWTSAPGNSSGPPASLGEYMVVVVSSHITKHGSTISGNVQQVIVVQVNPGYRANPGHAGAGTVLQMLCTAP